MTLKRYGFQWHKYLLAFQKKWTAKLIAMPDEKVPYGYKLVSACEKRTTLDGHFNAIAGNYDMADAVLSCGLHFIWKKETMGMLQLRQGERALDLCGGYADLDIIMASRMGPTGWVTLCDINLPMMKSGRAKTGISEIINFVQVDARTYAPRKTALIWWLLA